MRKTVMIVDDEQPLHDLYTKMLECSNYEVVNAYDGYEALSKLEEKRPDIIISDITLNMITGDALFLHVKSMLGYKDIPFIMMMDVTHHHYEYLKETDPDWIFFNKNFTREKLMEEVKAKIG